MARDAQRFASRFTSESVTEGHPDKLADQISDAILDAILTKDPLARVACETTVTTGLVLVAGEITTDCYVDIPRIIRQTIREVGYTRAKYGFDAETCGVLVSIDEQSPDIAQGVDVGGAGDSGMMLGFACDETPELMPMPISLAHRLARRLAEVRRSRQLSYLRPDGKVQVTVGYDSEGSPAGVESVVVSTQHHDEVETEQLRSDVLEHVVEPALADGPGLAKAQLFVNPTGRFVIGGPVADVGITGRKIMVDSYGGYARHGGGCFSGKDPTKVDRAGAYGARYVAKNVVAAGLARRCEVQLAYAIGVVKPVALRIDTMGTGRVPEADLERVVSRMFDLSPLGIIKELNLRRPLFRATACYGHFGRTDIDAPWEGTARAEELAAELN
ncbi:MAG: methionine adenosyltransferase [Candidatus Nephthysia bennettiae]|uniref:S-adenosylmethionine synthase n=1 Tax=Candidatus Nephthysia bennettiae TaxID=3127016 RepID=A0A934K3T8_9BACT|nr:methionine adenosyltransferase [Candidatus Dormibacteraeota bacterium]MBJ7613859.1 methionine adenosyltransferase [Candidatus Dormibacteraeota bacterium]PZR95618.1 MAG: methionine adenosyltransferase [Candidatus Dormibacteraeota bacterium]